MGSRWRPRPDGQLIQPLLRGAWARVVTQGLSLQERGVLYALRSFAEFRRQFYVGLVTGSGSSCGYGYLSLLFQLQSIRNTENNLKSYQEPRHLRRGVEVGFQAILERDQIAQNYQQPVHAVQLQAGLKTSLDLSRSWIPPADRAGSPDRRFRARPVRAQRRTPRQPTQPRGSLVPQALQNEEMPRAELIAAARDYSRSGDAEVGPRPGGSRTRAMGGEAR